MLKAQERDALEFSSEATEFILGETTGDEESAARCEEFEDGIPSRIAARERKLAFEDVG